MNLKINFNLEMTFNFWYEKIYKEKLPHLEGQMKLTDKSSTPNYLDELIEISKVFTDQVGNEAKRPFHLTFRHW